MADQWSSSFFCLPRELRDQIYDCLFRGCSLTFFNNDVRPDLGVTFHFFYQYNGTRQHQNLPRWLFACKQILNEGLEQWYRGASCSPCFCNPNNGRTLAGAYAAAFCKLDRVQSFDGPVLTPDFSADWDYFLWPSLPGRSKQRSQTIVPRMSEHWVSYAVLDCFFRYLQQHPDHPAKQIKFSLMITPSEYLTHGIEAVNLSYFETLGPRFDRVVFRIVCPYTSSQGNPAWLQPAGWPHLHANASIFPKLQHEAVRVGKSLVGATNSIGWHVRDYLEPMRKSNDEIIPNAFEWHIEVTRRSLQQSGQGQMQHEGLQYCRLEHRRQQRREYDYFRPLQTGAQALITSWVCDETGETMSLF
ncbi:hypothetical protein CC86DRAFT_455569 [Ophiobolus disseminans]|uniref:Uncharacterized protein n=1 Tax=Ophiobolus disseminans TaxID=1469910 RepID=A0A6A7A1K1_9PLEO|nr:hypothetical protein CC86DRAFT_455569 [Ophiobolus disseminans]